MLTKPDIVSEDRFAICPRLAALPGLRHAYFTRHGGVSTGIYESLNAGLGSGDERASVLENRARMAAVLGVAETDLATPWQVHSAEAVIVDHVWEGDRPKVDGVVTNKPGLAVGVVTADCGPVLFADAKARIVGACHAGWKGALTGILEDTIAKMERLGAGRDNIVATLGPTISSRNYEVGDDFRDRFTDAKKENARYFVPSKRDGHAMFDLPSYIIDRLNAAGVQGGNLDICTYAEHDRYFSYRQATHKGEPDYGRQLSAIVLEPKAAIG